MTVLLHPHIIGRPNRAFWLEQCVSQPDSGVENRLIKIRRFIKYITEKPGAAWVARRVDIAEHWQKNFPYDPKTAFGQTPVKPCGQIKIPLGEEA